MPQALGADARAAAAAPTALGEALVAPARAAAGVVGGRRERAGAADVGGDGVVAGAFARGGVCHFLSFFLFSLLFSCAVYQEKDGYGLVWRGSVFVSARGVPVFCTVLYVSCLSAGYKCDIGLIASGIQHEERRGGIRHVSDLQRHFPGRLVRIVFLLVQQLVKSRCFTLQDSR